MCGEEQPSPPDRTHAPGRARLRQGPAPRRAWATTTHALRLSLSRGTGHVTGAGQGTARPSSRPSPSPRGSAAPRTPGRAAFRGTTRGLRPILSVDGDRCGLRLLPLSNDATANSLSRLRVAFHALWGDVLSLGHSASVCPAISETTRVISKAAGS